MQGKQLQTVDREVVQRMFKVSCSFFMRNLFAVNCLVVALWGRRRKTHQSLSLFAECKLLWAVWAVDSVMQWLTLVSTFINNAQYRVTIFCNASLMDTRQVIFRARKFRPPTIPCLVVICSWNVDHFSGKVTHGNQHLRALYNLRLNHRDVLRTTQTRKALQVLRKLFLRPTQTPPSAKLWMWVQPKHMFQPHTGVACLTDSPHDCKLDQYNSARCEVEWLTGGEQWNKKKRLKLCSRFFYFCCSLFFYLIETRKKVMQEQEKQFSRNLSGIKAHSKMLKFAH